MVATYLEHWFFGRRQCRSCRLHQISSQPLYLRPFHRATFWSIKTIVCFPISHTDTLHQRASHIPPTAAYLPGVDSGIWKFPLVGLRQVNNDIQSNFHPSVSQIITVRTNLLKPSPHEFYSPSFISPNVGNKCCNSTLSYVMCHAKYIFSTLPTHVLDQRSEHQ